MMIKGETTGQITSQSSGDVFTDNPLIQINPIGTVNTIALLAKYEDYDMDGDGYYNEWVNDFHRDGWGDLIDMNNHIGKLGLINNGNTCYLNACLQLISHSGFFVHNFFKEVKENKLKKTTKYNVFIMARILINYKQAT